MSCVLDKSATAAAMFGVFRHEERRGRRRAGARAHAGSSAPHYPARGADRQADRSQADRKRRPSPTSSTASAPACSSSTRYGRIIHANAAGRAILPRPCHAIVSVEERVEAAPQPDFFADAPDGEQRAGDVGRRRGAGVVADGQPLVGGAEDRLAGEHERRAAASECTWTGVVCADRGAARFP